MKHLYDVGLDKDPANYVPLSPVSFLDRSAAVYPDRVAWKYGAAKATYRDFARRCRRLASSLSQLGIGPGDTVAVMAPNIPPLLELHFAVPMMGAVLNAVNTRLESSTISYILSHGGAKLFIVDREYSGVVEQAVALMDVPPDIVHIDDYEIGELVGDKSYDDLLSYGDPLYSPPTLTDEWNAISLNYTSGTTGEPKGVVYHHRGAYLNAVGNIMAWNMPLHPIYLWTLPMFHCNGWCFPWTVVAQAGTQICLRDVRGEDVWRVLREDNVTHLCGAPIVLSLLIDSGTKTGKVLERRVDIMTAASPPPPPVLSAIEELGFAVTHAYGLTECYGPGVVCAWQEEWNSLAQSEKAVLKARQGVRYPSLEEVAVFKVDTMERCPADGSTVGEVAMRGNILMKGYYKEPDATSKAFADGWFRTGDLGVMHPNGYLELKDRSKDIIISGGENISSIEVETVLYQHPSVSAVAVVARPDSRWGETPCAFVELKTDQPAITEHEIIEFCRSKLAHFKCPKTVVFGELARTSTGKIQKFLLRTRANSL